MSVIATEQVLESAESAANNPGYCDTSHEDTKGYFVQQTDPATIPTDSAEKTKFLFSCKSTVELTHNWGTEYDPEFKGYINGNSEPRCGGTIPNCAPRGYGRIGITVNDVYKACQRFQKLGVEFVKRPEVGRMKGLAFIKDPDGNWIEIFDVEHMSTLLNEVAV